MADKYKKCQNGHYYYGNNCPYCKSGDFTRANNETVDDNAFTEEKSNVDNNDFTRVCDETEVNHAYTEEKYRVDKDDFTRVYDETEVNHVSAEVSGDNTQKATTRSKIINNHTHIGKEFPMSGHTIIGGNETNLIDEKTHRIHRETRRLVGWLVSYTLDPMGVDFKLYEGRNVIGRGMDCNITVNDNQVSSVHAILLYRAGKYSITDRQSSNGTFVNDNDIELEPCYLSDGDIIKVGQTIFKFRSSL